MRTTILLAALLVASLTATAQADTFESRSGRYRADFPGDTASSEQEIPSLLGTQTQYMTFCMSDLCFYAVAYLDCGPMSLSNEEQRLVLEGAREGVALGVSGQITSDREVSVDGNPGMILKIDVPGQGIQLHAKIFMVNNRLYQMLVSAPTGVVEKEEINQFFDSFELIR